MQLHKKLFGRLVEDEGLVKLLATYDGRPAVFYQRAAAADSEKWSDERYPRIDYNLDMQENPSRNASGKLTLHIWCSPQGEVEPEPIEQHMRQMLHAAFVNAEEYPYCFGWVRSDSVLRKDAEGATGIRMVFDVMAFPGEYSMYPDPVKAINCWSKGVLKYARLLGEDQIPDWTIPDKGNPIIYWRLSGQQTDRKTNIARWLDVSLEGHVYARQAGDRLKNLVALNAAAALSDYLMMEDRSPMLLKAFSMKPHLNYLTQGQMEARANFALISARWQDDEEQREDGGVPVEDTEERP